MTTYARIANGAVERLVDLSAEQYAQMQANDKAVYLRLWVVDAKPTPGANQVVTDAGIVIDATTARQTWGLRQMTADETEAAAIATEVALLDERIAEISAQRAVDRTTWDAYTANQLRAEQWRDRQALLRAMHLLLRRAKRGAA
jgi:hypothetical protein